MSRSSLGRKSSGRVLRSRRLALVVILLAVAASLAFITTMDAGAAQDGEVQPRRSLTSVKGTANVIEGAEFVPGEVLVKFRTDAAAKRAEVAPARLMRVEDGLDLSVARFEGSEIVKGLRLALVSPERTLEAVAQLAAHPDVIYAEPNYIWRATRTPNDPRFVSGEMHGMNRINAPAAWDTTTGSRDVVVGVLDGGVDVNHPDLNDNIWRNPGETGTDSQGQNKAANNIDDDGNGYVDDINGWDFAACAEGTPITTICGNKTVFDNQDGDDHATHVAGTIGAEGNNGTGVVGVNWQVSIMSLKVLGPGGGDTADIIRGYNYVRMMRARGVNIRVLNNSYGGSGKSLSALEAIQQLNTAGILFVAASGNGGEDSRGDDNFTYTHFPANYDSPNVIAVASTTRNDGRSDYSNFGARVVSMGAPGGNSISTDSILSTTPNNTYSLFSGTSMAAPHVTGAAALVLAARPDITLSQLRGVLAYTGDRVSALEGMTTTGRRLNVANAVSSALDNDLTAPARVGNLRVTSPLTNGRNVTLAWTATGDDGDSGIAADYDFFYVNPATGAKTLLPTIIAPAPAGTEQSVQVVTPYRNFNGTILLRTYDNAGNSSDTTVGVAVADNFRSNPYAITLTAGAGLTPVTGTSLVTGDDKYVGYTLPFTFPYYRESVRTVTLSTNGALYFSTPPRRDDGDADDAGSAVEKLQGQRMIAGLWDDIDINPGVRADSGVFVTQPDANHVVFRWQGVTFESPRVNVNMEMVLRSDGLIQFRYGDNPRIFPVVGISNGEPDAYVVASHTRERTFQLSDQPINLTNAQTVTFTPAATTFIVSGRVTENGAGLAGVTLTLSGGLNSTTTTDANGNYAFAGLAGGSYGLTPSKAGYTFNPSGFSLPNLAIDATVNFAAVSVPAGPNSVGFAQGAYQYAEGDARATFTVARTGDTSGAVTVDYRTTDSDTFTVACSNSTGNAGGAYARCDFATTVGTLQFAPGEATKTITVPIIDDAHIEGAETFQLVLSNAQGTGTTLGTQNVSTATIQDNDAAGAPNPVVVSIPFFVRQQYLDFLSREPEAGEPWTGVMTRCPNIHTGPAVNSDCDRIGVSRAFFESPEFQLKGFYVFRFYKLAFDRLPLYTEIVSDMSFVAGQTPEEVYVRKAQLATAFVARPEFTATYGGMSNEGFVAALMGRYQLAQITAPDPSTPDSETRVRITSADLIGRLNSNQVTRAQAFRAVADSDEVQTLEFNSAFVAVQYYGYLRRTPEPVGYQDNLNALMRGTSRREMVNAFLNSAEYRLRFGQP